jgi:hypothetical protein
MPKVNKQQKDHKCRFCSNKFPQFEKLLDHISENHKYRCNNCKVSFKNKFVANTHFNTYHSHSPPPQISNDTLSESNDTLSESNDTLSKSNDELLKCIIKSNSRKPLYSGAVWCITCKQWSKGCNDFSHTTIFRVFKFR